jgi:hypothetical protein
MRIVKEEARILAIALDEFKYECGRMMYSKEKAKQVVASLTKLQERLEKEYKDKRWGRTSHTQFIDTLTKYCGIKNLLE